MGDDLTCESIERLAKEYGLDKPDCAEYLKGHYRTHEGGVYDHKEVEKVIEMIGLDDSPYLARPTDKLLQAICIRAVEYFREKEKV